MNRFFFEVSYDGTQYSGFQIQHNAPTIQSALQKALQVFSKQAIELTGSSRTDAGVHALQNFFHADSDFNWHQKHGYALNAILPSDIVLKHIYQVKPNCHARFDAISRAYKYEIYTLKNPFLQHTGWFFPFKINKELLVATAEIIQQNHFFQAFSKVHTQVNNFECDITQCYWNFEEDRFTFHIEGNRFLRGMVRALVATQLNVAKGKLSLHQFQQLFTQTNQHLVDFSAPAKGLTLMRVNYPPTYFL